MFTKQEQTMNDQKKQNNEKQEVEPSLPSSSGAAVSDLETKIRNVRLEDINTLSEDELSHTLRMITGSETPLMLSPAPQFCSGETCTTCAGLKCCARCKAVSYCSISCQTTDWPRHKKFCKTLAAKKNSDEPVSEFQTLLDKAVKLLNKYGISNCISSDSQYPASLRLEKAKVLYDISGRLLGMVRQCPMGSVGTLETVAQDGIRNYVNTYEDVHGHDPTACLRVTRDAWEFANKSDSALLPQQKCFYLFKQAQFLYQLHSYPQSAKLVQQTLEFLTMENRMTDAMINSFPQMAGMSSVKKHQTSGKIQSARHLGYLNLMAMDQKEEAKKVLDGSKWG